MPVVVLDESLSVEDLRKNPVKTNLLDVSYPYGKRDVEKKDWFGTRLEQVDEPTSVLVIKGTAEPICSTGATGNHLINAIVYAYNNHIGLRLSPDDILHCFNTAVVKCLNDNAEKYRDVFVNHQGKKKLVVKADCPPGQFDWSTLIETMSTMIDQNVKSGLGLEPEFTTTTPTIKTVGQLMKMSAFKQYFSYGFEMACGIRNVDLTGTLDDWLKLREKVTKCAEIFTKRGNLVNWSKHFLTVVDRLIETFNSDVAEEKAGGIMGYFGSVKKSSKISDKLAQFWARIVTYVPHGSGGQRYISGWAKVLVPGDQYDNFPEKLNLLDLSSKAPTPGNDRYTWQDKMKKWAQLCEEPSPGLSYVGAELNDNGLVYDFLCTMGHLGWKLNDNFTEATLSYVVHAMPKDAPEITSKALGSGMRKDNLEKYREEQAKHLDAIKAAHSKKSEDY